MNQDGDLDCVRWMRIESTNMNEEIAVGQIEMPHLPGKFNKDQNCKETISTNLHIDSYLPILYGTIDLKVIYVIEQHWKRWNIVLKRIILSFSQDLRRPSR
jgi:hypothetical protein